MKTFKEKLELQLKESLDLINGKKNDNLSTSSQYLNIDEFNKNTPENHQIVKNCIPMFFTGNYDSEYVIIELNPRKSDFLTEIFKEKNITNIDEYISYFSQFGAKKLKYLGREEKFDSKQKCFFKVFIDNFNRDKILQLELVPFASQNFDFKNYKKDNNIYLKKRIEEIEEIINLKPRKMVFISGAINKIAPLFDNPKLIFSTVTINLKDNYTAKYAIVERNNTKYCFISTYKRQGFMGLLLEEYAKVILNHPSK